MRNIIMNNKILKKNYNEKNLFVSGYIYPYQHIKN